VGFCGVFVGVYKDGKTVEQREQKQWKLRNNLCKFYVRHFSLFARTKMLKKK